MEREEEGDGLRGDRAAGGVVRRQRRREEGEQRGEVERALRRRRLGGERDGAEEEGEEEEGEEMEAAHGRRKGMRMRPGGRKGAHGEKSGWGGGGGGWGEGEGRSRRGLVEGEMDQGFGADCCWRPWPGKKDG